MPVPVHLRSVLLPALPLASLRRFTENYLATLSFLLISHQFYTHGSSYHQALFNASLDLQSLNLQLRFTSQEVFTALVMGFAVCLVPFYFLQPEIRSKAAVFLEGVYRGFHARSWWLSWPARQAGLNLLLKFFFAPMMINWCLAHVDELLRDTHMLMSHLQEDMPWRMLLDQGLFTFCLQLILLADTALFTLGYLLDASLFGNRIRSVDQNPWGWLVCIACYPPFNGYVSDAIPWVSKDFPQFESDAVHLSMNILILLTMAIYTWASIALGLKASNLTNRGIVSRGPYRWVRHPAYVCKNCAWWIGALPFFMEAFAVSGWNGMRAVLCMSAWTLIYTLRAITEERHLLRTGDEYRAYMAKVRWRFVPGLL